MSSDVSAVIEAALQMTSTDPAVVQRSNDFLIGWQKDEESLSTALEILRTNAQKNPIVVAAQAILWHVKTDWFVFIEDIRKETRELLLEIEQKMGAKHGAKVFVENALAMIGIVEFSSTWDSFFSDVSTLPSLSLLSIFTTHLLTTNIIQNTEKQAIRYEFIEFFPTFFSILVENPTTDGIEILAKISAFLPIELLVDSRIFDLLCGNLLYNPEFLKPTLRVIFNIVCLRLDLPNFQQIEFVLLTNLIAIVEDNPIAILCLANIINQHGLYFYILHYEDEDAVEIFRKSLLILADNKWSSMNTKLYWLLWKNIIDYFTVKSVSQFLVPFFPILFENFFGIIPQITQNRVQISVTCVICMRSLYAAAQDIILAGLSEAELSVNYICTFTTIESRLPYEMVEQQISSFISFAEGPESSEIVVAALLQCIQHSVNHFRESSYLQDAFISVLSEVLESTNETISWATYYMLSKLATEKPEVLWYGDLMQRVIGLLNEATTFTSATAELFRLIIKSMRKKKQQIPTQILTRITQEPLQLFISYAGQISAMTEDDAPNVLSLFKFIQVVIEEAQELAPEIGECVIDSALLIISAFHDSTPDTMKFINIAYRILLSMLQNSPKESVVSLMEKTITVLSESSEFSGLSMRIFALLRRGNKSVEVLFSEVYEKYIIRALEEMSEDSIEAFICLREFKYLEQDVEFPIEMVRKAIQKIPFHGINTIITFIHSLFTCSNNRISIILSQSFFDILDLLTTIVTDNFYDRFFMSGIESLCELISAANTFAISCADQIVDLLAIKMSVHENSSVITFTSFLIDHTKETGKVAEALWDLRTANMCGGARPQEDQLGEEHTEEIDIDISALSI